MQKIGSLQEENQHLKEKVIALERRLNELSVGGRSSTKSNAESLDRKGASRYVSFQQWFDLQSID
jgi:hypothetical protein